MRSHDQLTGCARPSPTDVPACTPIPDHRCATNTLPALAFRVQSNLETAPTRPGGEACRSGFGDCSGSWCSLPSSFPIRKQQARLLVMRSAHLPPSSLRPSTPQRPSAACRPPAHLGVTHWLKPACLPRHRHHEFLTFCALPAHASTEPRARGAVTATGERPRRRIGGRPG